MPYMVTFTINIPQMLAYIPYMDPMGLGSLRFRWCARYLRFRVLSVARSQLDLGSPGGLSV